MTVAERIAELRIELTQLEKVPVDLRDHLKVQRGGVPARVRPHRATEGTQGARILEHLRAHPEGQTVPQTAEAIHAPHSTVWSTMSRLRAGGAPLRHEQPLWFCDNDPLHGEADND